LDVAVTLGIKPRWKVGVEMKSYPQLIKKATVVENARKCLEVRKLLEDGKPFGECLKAFRPVFLELKRQQEATEETHLRAEMKDPQDAQLASIAGGQDGILEIMMDRAKSIVGELQSPQPDRFRVIEGLNFIAHKPSDTTAGYLDAEEHVRKFGEDNTD